MPLPFAGICQQVVIAGISSVVVGICFKFLFCCR